VLIKGAFCAKTRLADPAETAQDQLPDSDIKQNHDESCFRLPVFQK